MATERVLTSSVCVHGIDVDDAFCPVWRPGGLTISTTVAPGALTFMVGSGASLPAAGDVDTSNRATVARTRDGIAIMQPPAPGATLSEDAAINLAAWLVAMVRGGDKRLEAVLRAIRKG